MLYKLKRRIIQKVIIKILATDNNRDSNQDKLCYRDLKGLDFDPKLNPTGLENRLLNNSTAMVDILLKSSTSNTGTSSTRLQKKKKKNQCKICFILLYNYLPFQNKSIRKASFKREKHGIIWINRHILH